MTSTASAAPRTAPPQVVTVALVGQAVSPEALRAALLRMPPATAVGWLVTPEERIEAPASVDIVVCDSGSAATARRRWPYAEVLAIVPARDDGDGVLAAFNSGAQVCARGSDTALVAAYVQSIARRRGLLGADGAR